MTNIISTTVLEVSVTITPAEHWLMTGGKATATLFPIDGQYPGFEAWNRRLQTTPQRR